MFEKLMRESARLFGEGVNAVRRAAPASMSPEKQFVNATAAAMALLVAADGKVEEDETLAALAFLQKLPTVRELGLEADTIGYYRAHLTHLMEKQGDRAEYALRRGELLGDIGALRNKPEYAAKLRAMCSSMIGDRAEASEKRTFDDIMEALRA